MTEFYMFLNILCYLTVSIAVTQLKSTPKISTSNFYPFDSSFGRYNIRYTSCKTTETTKKGNVVFIHGFGGNADQFRKNLPAISSEGYDCFAIDLLGYGYSEKPNPKAYEVNALYNFDTWTDQCLQMIDDVIKEPAYIVCNSVGGIVGLNAAVKRPDVVKGVVLIDISLRLLHVKKQSPLLRPITSLVQYVLRETNAGKAFFKSVAKPSAIKTILSQAYTEEVEDDVVDIILKPGLEPGAVEVFLDFISYSGGPLPEDLLPQVTCPVRILWGEKDPWEPIAMGRKFSEYSCVDEFVTLPGAGHCPMDQVPDLVNHELLRFLK